MSPNELAVIIGCSRRSINQRMTELGIESDRSGGRATLSSRDVKRIKESLEVRPIRRPRGRPVTAARDGAGA